MVETAKQKGGRGLINRLIDKLPIELHLTRNYQYCGPGTHFEKRKALGQRGFNSLDSLCFAHDQTYHTSKDNQKRFEADKQLEFGAWNIARSKNFPLSERLAAWLVVNAMKLKTSTHKGSGMRAGRPARHRRHQRPSRRLQTRKPTTVTTRKKRMRKTIHRRGGNGTHHLNIKKGGFLPLLAAAIPIITALGGLVGGGAAVAKTVIDAKRSAEDLEETRRHNRRMEEEVQQKRGLAGGKGLYIRPYKRGAGGGGGGPMRGRGRPYRRRAALVQSKN